MPVCELATCVFIGADYNLLESQHLFGTDTFEVLLIGVWYAVRRVFSFYDHALYPVAPVEVMSPECAAQNVGCTQNVVECRVVYVETMLIHAE